MSKPNPLICGIYRIVHEATGRSYVGLSKNIYLRWRQHRSTPKAPRYELAHAFKKYGIDAFRFEVLEECEEGLLSIREQFWIAHFDSFRNGFNMSEGGELPPRHEEARKKQVAAAKARWADPEKRAQLMEHRKAGRPTVTDESRARISESMRMYLATPEGRAAHSAAMRGVKKSDAARQRMKMAQQLRKLSPEALEKIAASTSAANKGRKHTPEARAAMRAGQLRGFAERKAAGLPARNYKA